MYILLLNQHAVGSAVYFWYIRGLPPNKFVIGVLTVVLTGVFIGVFTVVGVDVDEPCTVMVKACVDLAPQSFV